MTRYVLWIELVLVAVVACDLPDSNVVLTPTPSTLPAFLREVWPVDGATIRSLDYNQTLTTMGGGIRVYLLYCYPKDEPIGDRVRLIVDGSLVPDELSQVLVYVSSGDSCKGPLEFQWATELKVGDHEVLFQYQTIESEWREYRWHFTITE